VKIKYTDSLAGITAEKLDGFFVGWPNPPSPQTHLKLLQQSGEVILALDVTADRVVGFVTAVTDGVLSAYLPFLEVLPEYQHRGIGSELVRRMLSRLDGLYMIDLCCDEDLRAFYERLGMKPAMAMARRDYAHQSGR
jgi:ribosomal protein S18 acetylase RimI-like enzyme